MHTKGQPVRSNLIGDRVTNLVRKLPPIEAFAEDLTTEYYYELRRRAAGLAEEGGDTRVVTVAPNDGEIAGNRKGALSPVHAFIKNLGGDFRTVQEVADEVSKQIGVHKSAGAIRNLSQRKRINAPSHKVKFGKGMVYLYTPEDVQEIVTFYKQSVVIEPNVN